MNRMKRCISGMPAPCLAAFLPRHCSGSVPGVASGAMRTMNQWLDEYGASHRNSTNEFLHWLCVPAIVMTVIGFLWSIPVPSAFDAVSPWLNWATIGVALWLGYYFLLSPPLGVGATI